MNLPTLTNDEIRDHNTAAAARELNVSIGAAYMALNTARAALDELMGPLYDVEYAEGTPGPDIVYQLEVAQRALRAAAALHERITR